MASRINNFIINIATVNGSGSQTANTILLKSLFRMGLPVGAKNFFPSNIQGMPTWFRIRVNKNGFTGYNLKTDILVNLNPKTVVQDVLQTPPGALFIHDQDTDLKDISTDHLVLYSIPYKKIIQDLNIPIKYRKFALSMVYVGFLAELLRIDFAIVSESIADHFESNANAIDLNQAAVNAGAAYYRETYGKMDRPFVCEPIATAKKRVLMDGNTAAAMGLVYGGCHFVSWYPITPSTSVIENFKTFTQNSSAVGKPIIVQAEDEQ